MKRRRLIYPQPPHPLLPIFHHQYPYDHHHHHLRNELVLLHPPMFIPQRIYNYIPPQPPTQLHQPNIHFLTLPPPQPYRPHILLRQPPPFYIRERQFVRPRKRRLQKESARFKVQSGKDCSEDNQHLTEEPSYGSFRGEEKEEGLDCVQTILNDKRESEATLAPPCPDDAKTDTNDANGCIIPLTSPLQPCSDANNGVEIAVENEPQNDTNFHGPMVGKASRSARRKKLKKAKMKVLEKISVQMSNDSGDVVNANNDCIIPLPASGHPHSGANNDSGEISVKNQSQKDMNSHSPIICVSRRARPKKSKKAKMMLLQKTSLQMEIGSGHANDCIIPSVSPQPRSCAEDLGEFELKNQRLHIPIFGSRGKKRKAKKKISHETGMMMINASGDIINISDHIIPSAPLQLCSGANGLGEIAVKNQPQKDTNLHSPTVDRSHSTRLKKWKARNKLLRETSIVSAKAGNNCDSCKPVVPNPERTRSSSKTLSASPYVANSVIRECFPRMETSAEDAKVQQYVHCTFLAKVSARHGGSLGFNQHGNDVHTVVSNEVPVVFDTEKSKIESVDQYANLGTDREVDDNSEHPLHNGSSLVDSFLEGIDIAGSSQGIRASSECDSALLLKPDSCIISGVGSADVNAKDVFLSVFDTDGNDVHKVTSNVVPVVFDTEKSIIESVDQYANLGTDKVVDDNSELPLHNGSSLVDSFLEGINIAGSSQGIHASSECDSALPLTIAVSSKMLWRNGKCYTCGEYGHYSSLCSKQKAANNAVSSKMLWRKCYRCREYGHISSLCPKVKAANNPVSSKIQRRTRICYGCRERGHISSMCSKVKAANNVVSSELWNYGCREPQHGNDVQKVVSNEVPVVFDTEKSKIKSVDQFANLGTDRVVDDNRPEHPLHNGSSLVDSFLGDIDIAGPSQGIHASSECDNTLPLKADSRIISGMGSADANAKDVFLSELDKPQIVRSEVNISSEATNAVSWKMLWRKCYSCGEYGHNSSMCSKQKAANKAVSSKIQRQICYGCREPGHISSMCPKVKAANNVVSSKIQKRICYGCREPGHISSMCPKVKAANNVVSSKIQKRICYGCREPGHISSMCPKMKADD
ncbi:hypothetical protein CASFOL_016766 [Castilleja foliolosa]|uniref:CCHC-type domain-containing protein n=1 Tax=Castilleja foliolosa TaxID=1961234 RepID=A0ABD3DCJ5_9LAMI